MIGKCSFCGLEKEVVAGAYGNICSDCCNTVIDEFDIKTDDSCGSNINLKPHKKGNNFSIYNGVLKCSSCGRAMIKQEDNRGKRNLSNYFCTNAFY